MFFQTYRQFFKQATVYQRMFNMERVNTYRRANPLALLLKKAPPVVVAPPHIDPDVLILPPIEVDRLQERNWILGEVGKKGVADTRYHKARGAVDTGGSDERVKFQNNIVPYLHRELKIE